MNPLQPKRVLRSDDEERDFMPKKTRNKTFDSISSEKENAVGKPISKKKSDTIDLTFGPTKVMKKERPLSTPPATPPLLVDSPPLSQNANVLPSLEDSARPLLQSCFRDLTPLLSATQHVDNVPPEPLYPSEPSVQLSRPLPGDPSQEIPASLLDQGDSNTAEAPRRMTSYYIRNFIAVVNHAYPRYKHLFTQEERDYVEKFQVLPFAAQRLFVRLYQRNRTWFKLQELAYDEIDDLKEAARTLAQSTPAYLRFVCSEAELHKDEALVRDVCAEVLKAEELRAVLRKCHRTVTAGKGLSTMKVEELLTEVADELRRGQKDLRGQRLLPTMVWRTLDGAQLLRLAPTPVQIFMRIDSLFFLAPRNRKAQNSFLLDEMGVMKYAQYEISEQFSRIFRSREEMLAWEAMNEIETKFDAAMASNNTDEALKIARMSVCWLLNSADPSNDPLLLAAAAASAAGPPDKAPTTPNRNPLKVDKGVIQIDSDSDEKPPPPPSPARVDSKGWQQADLRLKWEMLLGTHLAALQPPLVLQAVCLDVAAARQLVQERPFLVKFHPGTALALIATAGVELLEKRREYEAANLILRVLLSGSFVPSKRGRWWDRLTLNLEQHLKQKANALVLANAGLADPHVRSAHRQNLQKRVTRLHAPPLRWSQKPQFVSASLKSAAEVTISRTLLTSMTGRKSAFIGLDGNSRTVEEVALEHYAVEEGWNGRHTENGIFATLFGLLMWKCIFAPVPDVFHHPFQVAPLDWATDAFYESRKDLIEKHLGNLERGALLPELEEAFLHHEGERWPGVNWESFTLPELKRIAQCIGAVPLAKVLRLLARDYRHMMGGLPDLLLWRSEKPYAAKLVEVKGPRDVLSPKQIVWIDQLLACGMQVEVCHVAEM